MEIRFTDGGVFKFKVLDEQFTLKTPYGKLVIPIADVNQIEFATRIPYDSAKRIRTAVADLASTEFKKARGGHDRAARTEGKGLFHAA